MAETPHYSHNDIARYLQHAMSPQEMHAFEKALMDDPFLADALEGFSASDPAAAHADLANIEQQLTSRREKTKVVPLMVKKSTWWKAAAIILIISAGGALSYVLLRDGEKSLLIAREQRADTTKEVAINRNMTVPAEAPVPATDKTGKKGVPALRTDSFFAAKPYTRAKPAPSTLPIMSADTTSYDVAGSNGDAALIRDSASAAPVWKNETARSGMAKKMPQASALNEFKGKLTGRNGQSIPFVSITNNTTHDATSSDAQGNFTLKGPDSVLSITVNGVGYSDTTATISSGKLNKIALEESSQSLQEVVIVGYGSQKKMAVTGSDSSGLAEPVGGWKSFEQYLNRKIDSLHTADSKNLYSSGDVVLEFFVDQKGNPANIEVQDQPSEATAKKAVEILANGPRWKNTNKNKKVKVVIPFGAGK